MVCPKCGAVFVVKREQLSNERRPITCLQCWSMLSGERAAEAVRRARSLSHEGRAARTMRIRLRWEAGYVSDYPDPLDDDTSAVMLNVETGKVTLHANGGAVHYFTDSGEKDEDGFAIYRELRLDQQAEPPCVAPSRALLPASQTFDYVATVPEADGPSSSANTPATAAH